MYLSGIAKSVVTMILGRVLTGVGIGISSAIVPLYISEVVFNGAVRYSFPNDCVIHLTFFHNQISPTEIRGTLGSVNQLSICIGILAALVAGLPLAGNPLWYFLLANMFL